MFPFFRRMKKQTVSDSRIKNCYRRRPRVEPLERRDLLSITTPSFVSLDAAENVFSRFVGVYGNGTEQETVEVSVNPRAVSSLTGEVKLGFHFKARNGDGIDPQAIGIVPLTASSWRQDVAVNDLGDSTDSVVVATLTAGDYQICLDALFEHSNQYELDVYLVGDADGDRQITKDDLLAIKSSYGSFLGDDRYNIAADADLNGLIDARDLAYARENWYQTALPAPTTQSTSLSVPAAIFPQLTRIEAIAAQKITPGTFTPPSMSKLAYGPQPLSSVSSKLSPPKLFALNVDTTQIDAQNAVLPLEFDGDYATRGAQCFFESTEGWVQDFSPYAEERRGIFTGEEIASMAGSVSGLEALSFATMTTSDPGPSYEASNAAVRMTWVSSDAGYDNMLNLYECDANGQNRVWKASLSGTGTEIVGIGSERYYTFIVAQGNLTPNTPGDGNYSWCMWSTQNVDNYAHFQTSGGQLIVEDLSNDAENYPNPGSLINDADFNDIVFTHQVWTVDIDTDSDNDGDVDRSSAEDAVEDVSGGGIGEVGKRIFINTDDDNKNGVADRSDIHRSDYTASNTSDDDFAEIKLAIGGIDTTQLDGYELWLGHPSGVNLYAGKDKLGVVRDMGDPSDMGQRSYTIPTYQAEVGGGYSYTWELGSAVTLPSSLYVQGGLTGNYDIQWQLRDSSGTILARDTVEINVEKIVYPFTTQDYQNWQERPTTDWVGLEVAQAWYINKALVNYITAPGSQGNLETIHPDLDDPTTPGTQLTWSSADGPDSTTTESYANGFTMEFDYSFERSRGDGTYGYVKIDPEKDGTPREKLSFVGNSGVKFGGIEAAILDVSSYIGYAGGVTNFNPSPPYYGYVQSSGNVDTNGDFETEPLNKLMTGVKYGGDYDNIKDYQDVDPDDPPTAQDFYDTLVNNGSNTNGHIKISWNASTYMLNIYLDNAIQASYSEFLVLSVAKLDLQSHWGSGVIFSNMDITPYNPT